MTAKGTRAHRRMVIEGITKIEAFVGRERVTFPSGVRRFAETINELGTKKVVIVGNGGSSAIASHFAIDLIKAVRVPAMAIDSAPVLTCMANDFGYERVFAETIAVIAEEEELLVAISSSGMSPNIIAAVNAAREKSCEVITLSGFDRSNALSKMGDINFYVPSRSYRVVELAHQFICDCVIEALLA